MASRAEAIYEDLDRDQQEAARQLFLRMVTVGRDSETRRAVAAAELIDLDVDTVTMHAAVEAFVVNRLLVRDRDALSGALTVEVAHEALLSEWARLRRWIDDGRDDLRQHAAYTLAVDDWLIAGRDPDMLLTGGRLEQFELWRGTTNLRLTASEREFIDAARRRRNDAEAAEMAQAVEQDGCVAGPGGGRSARCRGCGDDGCGDRRPHCRHRHARSAAARRDRRLE